MKRHEFYRGNITLKKAGVAIEWTPSLISEYIKCKNDPIYFIENYMKVVGSDTGLTEFRLFDYQRDMVTKIHENRYVIIATSRRAGKSTVTLGYLLWYIIFHPYKTVAVLSNKGETSIEMLDKLKVAYENLPKWIQPGVVEWQKKSAFFENGSRALAATTTKDAIRGYNIDILFLDEAAHIEKFDEFYAAVYPTISSGKNTKLIMASTPLGLNHFHDFFAAAEKGTNGYVPIKVVWTQVPFYDETWRLKTLAALNHDQQKFDQEYCVAWLGSSGTLIAGWKLEELKRKTAIVVPIYNINGLRQYKRAEKDRVYVLVADVSEGKGLDYSAFSVIDVTSMPYEQVAVFYDNLLPPIEYTETIFRVASFYNKAHVLIENNINLGGQIADTLYYDYEYENLIHSENAGRDGKRVTYGFGGKKTEKGLRTTKPVKAIGCSMLKLLVEQEKLILNDNATYKELATFSRKKQSYEAEAGKNDDLVMGLVLFSWLTNQDYFKELNDINTLAKLREKSEDQIINELTPFGFIDNGVDEIPDQIDDYFGGGNWMFPSE